MAPEERRKAIVEVLVPLIAAKGGEVSTREIALAAGIAEGTIFRAFPDKKSLLMAAAEEAINPADGQRTFEEALAGAEDLRAKVVIAAGRVLDRMHLTMSVMYAVRHHLMGEHGDHESPGAKRMGPPPFVMKAQEDLHRRLLGVFEPHAAELAFPPDVAATALRSLIFGAARPELGQGAVLTPDQIADLVLDGVRRREND
jgi:AcrR family transcriptional regulator